MSRFLIFFFSLYAAVHVFVISRARALLPERAAHQAVLYALMALFVLAPIMTRLLERRGHEDLALFTAYPGYIWMAFMFLLFSGFFITGALQATLRIGGMFLPIKPVNLSGRGPALFIILLSCLMLFYGYFEARNIRVEKVAIHTDKLAPEKGVIRIAQITDVHLGVMVGVPRLKRIVDRIRPLKPDIVISTGDLVDSKVSHNHGVVRLLAEIRPRYGKYAVTGNHEFYVGIPETRAFHEKAGFELLRDRVVTVGGLINIAGVDDSHTPRPEREAEVLSNPRNGLFTLFLKHRPTVAESSLGLFDLQLSGHVHRGQIFPFNFITGLFFPLQDGFYPLKKGSSLYTSRGSGTWGPPMRVLSPPEVTLIELIPAPHHGETGKASPR